MNGIHLIAIAFLASWTVITASKLPIVLEECPVPDTCPPKLISHADCTKFYECKNSQKVERTCSTGLYFSLKWRGCVDQASSDCYTPPPECPVPDTCPPKLISHADCTKFYECKNSQKVERTCSDGLYFSQYWRGCVDRANSDCPPTPTPTPTPIPTPTPTPTPIPTPTSTPRDCTHDGELLPHECTCVKFYECKNGRKALRDCPAGQHFDTASRTCIPGEKCEETPTPAPPQCNKEGEFLPHECQCNKYYECKGGRKALRECNPGMHFDENLRICVQGEDCGKTPKCVNGDAKKHECYCDKYYRCINEDWMLEYCTNGEHFSEANKTCMDPIDAGCDPNIEPGDCSSSSPPQWPHECDCRLYYQCENRKMKIYECSWGSCFNNATLKCELQQT